MNNRFLALWITIILWAGTWMYDFWGIQYLRHEGMFLKFQRLDSKSFDQLCRDRDPAPENKNYFSPKLSAAGLGGVKGDESKIVFILEWVMNRVKLDQLDFSSSAIEAYEKASQNEGLTCESMSRVFVAAARAAGFRARSVQLVRSLLDEKDTHVTAEVLLGGRWVIFDPTFNVSYRKNGRLIGTEEIRQSLLSGAQGKIKPVFYGEVVYPARLEKYYLGWLALYNNLFIFEKAREGFWSKVPPFRYWRGPRYCYLEMSPAGLWHFQSANLDYFKFVVVLPILGIFFSVFVIGLWRKNGAGRP